MTGAAPRDVVVIGGGVAGLAAAWALGRRGARVVVVERKNRLGGLVETERPEDGVTIEHGADAVLSSKPGGMPVLAALGLDRDLVGSGRAPRRAFVLGEEGLVPMPAGLFSFERRALLTMLASPLLSPRGKLRLSLEPLARRGDAEDESVRAFFARRLGAEVEARLVAPMVRGIYGASSSELGVRSAFPALAGFEDRFGSVALALLWAPRPPRGAGLVTPHDGMELIPRRLFEASGARVVFKRAVRSIELGARRARVRLDDGSVLDPEAVVVATDVATAAGLLGPLDRTVGELLGAVRSTDAEVVTLAYAREAIAHPLDGTGFVVGRSGLQTVACTFASEKWRGRAPEGIAVFRSVLSGARDATDAELVLAARKELREVLGAAGRPLWHRIRRRRGALPTSGVGHHARIDRVLEGVRALGRVGLAGNYLRGVGVPDAITTGVSAAETLLS